MRLVSVAAVPSSIPVIDSSDGPASPPAVFGGCDYLCLSGHPRLAAAVTRGLARDGVSSSASRTTTGNRAAHDELEAAIAAFFGRVLPGRAATLTLDGLTANIAAMEGLAVDHGVALLDERTHRSQLIAARAAGLRVVTYRHLDAAHALEEASRLSATDRVLVSTDGVFAADGAVAPVRELLAGLPGTATLLLDDCHGIGVMGRGGRGLVERFGLDDPRLVVTSTLAKAVGASGGFVLGTPAFTRTVRTRATAFIGTTPIPPALAAAAAESLRIIDDEPERLRRLATNCGLLAAFCASPRAVETPIVALPLPAGADAERCLSALAHEGFRVPLVRYPGGPAPEYFRVSVHAGHEPRDIERLRTLMVELAIVRG